MATDSVDMKLEVVMLAVSDVDRAKAFYEKLGWRIDIDVAGGDFRGVQITPHNSEASIIFGKGLPAGKNLVLAVDDIEAARAELVARGIDVSEVFHYAGGPAGFGERTSGPAPDHNSYGSFALFGDPDGNTWLLQEITSRLPGRIDPAATSFASVGDLASALRRAAAAHGEHEKRTGEADANWPDWYAAYMVAEQAGGPLPS